MNVNQAKIDAFASLLDVKAEFSPFNYSNGVIFNMIVMASAGVVYFLLLLMIEFMSKLSCTSASNHEAQESTDNDVMSEKRRVLQSTNSGALIAQNLGKVYTLHNMRRLFAVKGLNFAVQPGEVRFGF